MEDGKEIGYTEWADDVVKESGSVWCAISVRVPLFARHLLCAFSTFLLPTQYRDFVHVVHEAALGVGAKFYTNAPVAFVTPPTEGAGSKRPFITLEDGRRFDADVVVGCDGAYSVVRQVVEEEPTQPERTGLISFAGDVCMEDVVKDPYLKKDDIINGMPFWATTGGALRGTPSAIFLLPHLV